MRKYTLIRTIYLYTFALIGLVLAVIGGVRLVDMGLKAFVFTQAEEEQRFWQKQPPMPIISEKRAENIAQSDKSELSAEEKEQLQQWLATYKDWKDRQEKFDSVTASRHREAASSLAFILVGLPLYWYHWRVISKEKAGNESDSE